MAKAGQDRPLKAVESTESDDLTLEQAKVELGIVRQQNAQLKAAMLALGNDLMTLRDFCNRVAG